MNSGDESSVKDEAYVRAYLNGDPKAFEMLYRRYRERLFGYVMRSCSSVEHAEELFQEIWLKVLISLDRYVESGRFRSWLFTCAHNAIVDFYRKQESKREDALTAEHLGVESTVDNMDLPERINEALKSLPLEQRQAFYLREELTCSIKDIAGIQGCSDEAAKSRLRYAYARLRSRLSDTAE